MYVGLFCIGALESLRGILLPEIQNDLGLSHTLVGVLLIVSFLGFFIASFFSGFACDWFSDKPIIFFGLALITIASVLFLTVKMSFVYLLLVYFVSRFGIAAVDIPYSAHGSRIFKRHPAFQMNILHLTFGIGAALAPLFSSRLLINEYAWQRILGLSAIPFAVLLMVTLFTKFTYQQRNPVTNPLNDVVKLLRHKKIWLMGFLLAIALVGEGNIIEWLKNFVIQTANYDTQSSGTLLSIYYFCFVASRLVSGFVADKVGIFRICLVYIVGSVISFYCGVFLDNKELFFGLMGWFIGPLFPLVIVVASRAFVQQKGSSIGVVLAIAGMTATLNSLLVGVLHDALGTLLGFSFIGVALLFGLPITYATRKSLQGTGIGSAA